VSDAVASNKRPGRHPKLAIIAVIVGWALTVAGGVWVTAAEHTRIASGVEQQASQIEDHEQRLRAIEREIGDVASDVRWIRGSIESGGGRP
jgi:outer membrane murein-binding lipoprotein Lpp